MKGANIHPALARGLQFFQDRLLAEWPAHCQHDNRPKKNDDRCQRNTHYKFPRFAKRSGSDSLLHLCAREPSFFEASNCAWVGNSFLWQGSHYEGKLWKPPYKHQPFESLLTPGSGCPVSLFACFDGFRDVFCPSVGQILYLSKIGRAHV